MNIYDVFDILDGDAETVLARFAGNEGLWKRFAGKFSDDETFQRLNTSIDSQDYKGIEMYAHTLKGVAANLGFEQLSRDAASIVSAAREQEFEKVPSLFNVVAKEYNIVLDCVGRLD